jgi:hypothetical protein
MSDADIYDAFAIKVGTFAAQFSPAMPASYPGIGFDPPSAGMWLECQWFPNETQNYGIGNEGPSLLQGFGQLSVCYRPGGGIVPGLAVADLIIAAFGKGTVLYEGIKVYRKPWTSSVIQDPERVMHPVTIPWRGFDG